MWGRLSRHCAVSDLFPAAICVVVCQANMLQGLPQDTLVQLGVANRGLVARNTAGCYLWPIREVLMPSFVRRRVMCAVWHFLLIAFCGPDDSCMSSESEPKADHIGQE